MPYVLSLRSGVIFPGLGLSCAPAHDANWKRIQKRERERERSRVSGLNFQLALFSRDERDIFTVWWKEYREEREIFFF